MQTPGPDHPIEIKAHSGRINVRYNGALVATTENALVLRESSYPAVYYIPERDTRPGFFTRSQHHTHCPYKGEASYYNLVHAGEVSENAAWTYENPYPAVAMIQGHLAFYPEQVSLEIE